MKSRSRMVGYIINWVQIMIMCKTLVFWRNLRDKPCMHISNMNQITHSPNPKEIRVQKSIFRGYLGTVKKGFNKVRIFSWVVIYKSGLNWGKWVLKDFSLAWNTFWVVIAKKWLVMSTDHSLFEPLGIHS